MKTLEFKVLGKDQYLVIRVNDKYPKGDPRRYAEYLVDLRNGDMLCSCEDFYYTKKACNHVKFILAQLKIGGGILDFKNKPHKAVEEYNPPKKRQTKLDEDIDMIAEMELLE